MKTFLTADLENIKLKELQKFIQEKCKRMDEKELIITYMGVHRLCNMINEYHIYDYHKRKRKPTKRLKDINEYMKLIGTEMLERGIREFNANVELKK